MALTRGPEGVRNKGSWLYTESLQVSEGLFNYC